MDESFAGEFGGIASCLARVAALQGRPVGAILAVDRSIWDPELDGPFTIDLFVHPDLRGIGVVGALLDEATQV